MREMKTRAGLCALGLLPAPYRILFIKSSGQARSMANKDYSVRQLLELEACTNCRYCAEVCPAVNASRRANSPPSTA